MKLSAKTLSGVLHGLNRNSCDWGWQGLLAYGCQNLVVIIDPATVQVVQCLDKHKGYVVKLKWSRENYHHDVANPYSLSLASADHNGRILVWDVSTAAVKCDFSDSSKPVADMEWLSQQDASHHLLVVLHPPYSFVLWNVTTGTKLWKKSYTETLNSVSFNPFDSSKLAFLGADCILFVDDFSVFKCPSSNGRKFYVSTPSSSLSQSQSSERLAEKRPSKTALSKRMSNILVGETNKKSQEDEVVALNECLQLAYHQACRDHMILVYPREILILDLAINQTVGIIPLERTASPFLQVLPLCQRDVMLCLHESGCVTVRVRRRTNKSPLTPAAWELPDDATPPVSLDVTYDLRGQSDALRVTRCSKVYGITCSPITEQKVALVMSDGRTLFWELKTWDHQGASRYQDNTPLYTPGPTLAQGDSPLPDYDLTTQLNLFSSDPQPRLTLCDLIECTQTFSMDTPAPEGRHGVQLKFVLTGMLTGVAAPPLVVRMCPPLTTKNWAHYKPLLALGAPSGVIQVYNASSGELTREFSIHTSAIKGIEWVSLHSFISHAFIPTGNSTLGKNDICLTDIRTGRTVAVRANREDESPVDTIKMSYLKQYLVLLFKDRPFELWDVRSCTLLRQMPKHFPLVTALEWSPSHHSKSVKKSPVSDVTSLTNLCTELNTNSSVTSSTTSLDPSTRPGCQTSAPPGPTREHFVFTDADSLLYHFVVEGSVIKDGSKIPPDGSMGSITCIVWKGETLVLGDADGNLNLWDLRARVSRAVPTHRGAVKKLRFAPGRGNMMLLVLYGDGADVWDTRELEPIFCPHILPPKASLTLKCLLQHQPWNQHYELCIEETEENADICQLVKEQLDIIDSDLKAYLPQCQFGTAQRCLLTARLFGDEMDVTFWTVAVHYLRAEKACPHTKEESVSHSQSQGDLFIPTTPVKDSGGDLVSLEDEDRSRSWSFIKDRPLEARFDILCDSLTFQKQEMGRLNLHDSKRATYEQTCQCVENLILLGQADRAVQLLLETEADNNNYYVDSLRACLVASIRSSGASQSTIKLVATNLIANGRLSEGVQQLCLIDKGLDACRYLQTYGHWRRAAWLAKVSLGWRECQEVLRRWVDHLISPQVNQQSLAVLVLLSIGQFVRVIELLLQMRHIDRAALFVEACQEFQLLDSSAQTSALVETVFHDYARSLLQLGHRTAAEYYSAHAGVKGQQLLKEIASAYNTN
ncbi:hypothetical protein NP493_1127g02083 [Ridgeia piscesae]|uniref:WD repeat-containing protein 11 n=1 Tax=Ridgeia piscesae TaxID=27915 RepID=A0AAD9NI41_RIDPI|nr:hypothetical protein NP493_1127g02083 [Ridgeia piscesae]